MPDDDEVENRRTNIGGRYGSPTVTIAWPFSNIVNRDDELRDEVANLASIVARLALAGTDETELAMISTAAHDLSTRVLKQER